MTTAIGKFVFDLVLPFETGGMDASGFTVAPGVAQGPRAGLARGQADSKRALRVCRPAGSAPAVSTRRGGLAIFSRLRADRL
jgi:hypothetical protein